MAMVYIFLNDFAKQSFLYIYLGKIIFKLCQLNICFSACVLHDVLHLLDFVRYVDVIHHYLNPSHRLRLTEAVSRGIM